MVYYGITTSWQMWFYLVLVFPVQYRGQKNENITSTHKGPISLGDVEVVQIIKYACTNMGLLV